MKNRSRRMKKCELNLKGNRKRDRGWKKNRDKGRKKKGDNMKRNNASSKKREKRKRNVYRGK